MSYKSPHKWSHGAPGKTSSHCISWLPYLLDHRSALQVQPLFFLLDFPAHLKIIIIQPHCRFWSTGKISRAVCWKISSLFSIPRNLKTKDPFHSTIMVDCDDHYPSGKTPLSLVHKTDGGKEHPHLVDNFSLCEGWTWRIEKTNKGIELGS